MNTSRRVQIVVLCALLTVTLAACGSAQDSGSQGSDMEDLGKVQAWLTQVAWSAAGVPVIGPLITGILQEVAPQDHWCVGAVLIFLILSALGGGSSSSGRG